MRYYHIIARPAKRRPQNKKKKLTFIGETFIIRVQNEKKKKIHKIFFFFHQKVYNTKLLVNHKKKIFNKSRISLRILFYKKYISEFDFLVVIKYKKNCEKNKNKRRKEKKKYNQ